MAVEHRRCGALARAVLATSLFLALFAGAAQQAEARVRAAGIAHHHHYFRTAKHYRHARRHRLRFSEFPYGPATAKPILTFEQPSAPQMVVFGHYEIGGDISSSDLPFGAVERSFGAGIDATRGAVADLVRRTADRLGVPANLALAIMRYESGGRCGMRGRAGERGAMQVLPQTARLVGVVGNLYDCAIGIEAGLRYLKLAVAMHATAGWCAVASAYNSGTWHGSRCTPYGRAIALAAGLR
jgi:Transglycosylase SLT domain